RSPRHQQPCRSCDTNLCAAMRQGEADKRERRLKPPRQGCRARGKKQKKKTDRNKKTSPKKKKQGGPPPLTHMPQGGSKAGLDATSEPCPGGPASVIERILAKALNQRSMTMSP